ncbi:MAG: hypothetical protein V4679_18245 [Pseudomonadota bacterium]
MLMMIPAILLIALLAAIAWGGPRDIAPLASVKTPFAGVDFSGLPPVQRYTARDGTPLAWHAYGPAMPGAARPVRRVGLVHGSSSRARAMHVLAQALASGGVWSRPWTCAGTATPARADRAGPGGGGRADRGAGLRGHGQRADSMTRGLRRWRCIHQPGTGVPTCARPF